MASTPHQFPGAADKVCNQFLHVKDKDAHELFSVVVSHATPVIILNIAVIGLMRDGRR